MVANPNPMPSPEAPGTGETVSATADHAGDEDGLLARVIEWYKAARDHWADWRKEAFEAYDFVAGHQWSEEDASVLDEQGRPAITFNRVGPFVDAICGLEISNRQETRYIPRTLGSAGINELLSDAAKWVRGQCDAEDEESGSFRDMTICGLGWTETRLSYDADPDGIPVVERVDPLEMLSDPAARKDNLTDARYVLRIKDLPLAIARELAPDADDVDLDATWVRDESDEVKRPTNARLAPFYKVDMAGQLDQERQYVRLVEVEWWESETAFRVLDPATGKQFTLDADQHAMLKERAGLMGVPFRSVKDKRRRYRKALIGGKVLSVSDGAESGGFSYKAMTGKRDRNKAIWYGLVRAMKDPQMWANKWLAQVLHIINSNAKGGLLAEEDAFEDTAAAEDSWADPQAITWTAPGAIQQGKIKDKPPITYPAGLDQLMQWAISSFPSVTGVNPEMLGQVDREQPGVLEMHRTQRGMSVLASFFDAKRRYQKEQGRLLLWMIRTFISDGRLIRVGGQEDAQYVRLIHDPSIDEYDVIVDDTPWSPNQRERTWQVLTQMLPILARGGLPPHILLEILKYSPLPEALVGKIQKMMLQQQQQQGQMPPAQQALIGTEQAKAELHKAQAAKVAAETQLLQSEAGTMLTATQADIEAKRASAIANLAKAGISTVDARLNAAAAATDALLRTHQMQHDITMDRVGLAQQSMQPQPMMQPGGQQMPPGLQQMPAQPAPAPAG